MKRFKTIMSLILIMTMAFMLGACFEKCDPDADIYVEGKVWNYFKLRQGKDGIALTGLQGWSNSHKGQTLYIPTEVDGYKVVGLTGRDTTNIWGGRVVGEI